MELTPKHEHDLWVAAFTAALSESAIKLIDSTGSTATGGDRVGLLVGKAVEIANLAADLYKEVWGVDLADPVLSPGDRATVVRGLKAGFMQCVVAPEKSSTDSQSARVRLVRALRVFGIAGTAGEPGIPPAEDAQLPQRYALKINGPLFRAQRQLLLKLLQQAQQQRLSKRMQPKEHQALIGSQRDEELLHGLISLTDEIADQAHDDYGEDCLFEDVADTDKE